MTIEFALLISPLIAYSLLILIMVFLAIIKIFKK